jgi:hypothetical protein
MARTDLTRSPARLDDARRLDLILEAVRYCQRVRGMGMPASCYGKALREPVYFLWECRDGRSKERRPQYRSKASIGVRFGKGELVYDHAIPFRYLQEELLSLENPVLEQVADVLNRHAVVVLITKSENLTLTTSRLASRMPDGWDGADPFARYKAAGIEVMRNEDRLGAAG